MPEKTWDLGVGWGQPEELFSHHSKAPWGKRNSRLEKSRGQKRVDVSGEQVSAQYQRAFSDPSLGQQCIQEPEWPSVRELAAWVRPEDEFLRYFPTWSE